MHANMANHFGQIRTKGLRTPKLKYFGHWSMKLAHTSLLKHCRNSWNSDITGLHDYGTWIEANAY